MSERLLVAGAVTVPGRLRPLSLELSRGEVLALVGPNGSGKSTFLDCVLGLVPFTGTLELATNQTLAIVPQRFEGLATTPVTVLEFLAASRTSRPSWLGVPRATRRAVEQALELTGCSALLGARLSELSGGELRRVLLADALATKPSLLLLDEPEAGLDAAARARLLTTLRDARTTGLATLWISHDLEAVGQLATRTASLSGSAA
jgi:ABC-type Mn2+/Zn2+ transport system ATPase subunit